jgi:hypothetical protein
MPKYFLIGGAYLAINSVRKRHIPIGEIIEFDGVPNSGMVPIDLEGHAAKERSKLRAGWWDVDERRLREALPRSIAAELKVHEEKLAQQLRGATNGAV